MGKRRLYELARKHLGQQPIWQIGLPRLAEKCGSRRELRKARLRRLLGLRERMLARGAASDEQW